MSVVVLGIATYRPDQVWNNIELLVRSVRRNSPHTDIALLTARLGERDRGLFARHRIQAFELVDEVPKHDLSTDAGIEAMHRWKLEMFGVRHRHYLDALNALAHTHILLTDTRDVVVTSDLDAACATATLILSQEDATRSIGEESYNRRWILEGYGQAELDRIGRHPILCAGTVFGPRTSMVDYVRAMKNEVERIGVEMTGRIGDQPLHNHLAYSGKLPDFTTSRAEDGWLRSIGVMPSDTIRMDWASSAPSTTADPVRVIHQYDRHLARASMRRAVANVAGLGPWHPWRFQASPMRTANLAGRIIRRVLGYLPVAWS